MSYLQNLEAVRRMIDRKRVVAEEINEIGWLIWALEQEDARLSKTDVALNAEERS